MNFGAEIADDFFENPKPKEKDRKISVFKNIKKCSKKWFLEDISEVPEDDEEEALKRLKYKADYFYFEKEYSKAIELFKRCLGLLPTTNIPVTRECMEGLSRSLLKEGHPEKALEWALKLHDSAESVEQAVASWSLLATVCHALGKYEEELEALHSCVETLKNNPDFWLRLSYCYSGLFSICLPSTGCVPKTTKFCCNFKERTFIPVGTSSSSDSVPEDTDSLNCKTEDTVHESSENAKTDSSDCAANHSVERCEECSIQTQVMAACLIRTRILINKADNQSVVSRRRLYLMNKKVDSCLAHMEIEQIFIDEATKMLKAEMYPTSDATKNNAQLKKNNHKDAYGQDPTESLSTLKELKISC